MCADKTSLKSTKPRTDKCIDVLQPNQLLLRNSAEQNAHSSIENIANAEWVKTTTKRN
jgi:hypothetical protein